MSSLSGRLALDLRGLAALADATLPSAEVPPHGQWVRTWDKRVERPGGPWHRLGARVWPDTATVPCGGALLALVMARQVPEHFALHHADRLPPHDPCVRCMRYP